MGELFPQAAYLLRLPRSPRAWEDAPPAEHHVPASNSEDETLEGDLDRIVYESPKGDFFVALFRPVGGAVEVRVVGELGGARIGEHVRLFGRWVNDPKWGRQFRVGAFQPVLPTSAAGIERYLATAGIKGVGKKMARRIVEAFGTDALEILQSSPSRLVEVEGLGKARAQALSAR